MGWDCLVCSMPYRGFPSLTRDEGPFQYGSTLTARRDPRDCSEGVRCTGSRGAFASPVTRHSSTSCARRLVTEGSAMVRGSLEWPTVEFDMETAAAECAFTSWGRCVLTFRGTAAVIALTSSSFCEVGHGVGGVLNIAAGGFPASMCVCILLHTSPSCPAARLRGLCRIVGKFPS